MALPSTVSGSSFSADISKFVEKAKGNTDKVLRKLLFDLSKGVIGRTPRDTGRLVGNWQFGEDQIPSGEVGDAATFKDQNGDAVAEAMLMLYGNATKRVHAGHVHYVVNNLPYAPVVEYGLYPNPPMYGSKKRGEAGMAVHVSGGYSMQAPQGMVRVTVVEFQQYVRDAVRDL